MSAQESEAGDFLKIFLNFLHFWGSFSYKNVSYKKRTCTEFISFCENFSINIKTRAAESPWSDGLVERHNGVLGNIVRKMMSEKPNYSLETGATWAIAAKDTLKNKYGFSLI